MIKKLSLFLLLLGISALQAEIVPISEEYEMDNIEYSDSNDAVVSFNDDVPNGVLLPINKLSNRSTTSSRSAVNSRNTNTAKINNNTRKLSNSVSNRSNTANSTRSTVQRSAINSTTTSQSRNTLSRNVVTKDENTTKARSAVQRNTSNSRGTLNKSRTAIAGVSSISVDASNANNIVNETKEAAATLARVGMINSLVNSTSNTKKSKSATTSNVASISSLSTVQENYDSCKEKYFSCMNNFCGAFNTSAKTCSCSSKITSLKQTETNLSDVTMQLYQVIQNISYIGYSSEEVKAMFTATEGELAMKEDTSENKQILEDIDSLLSGNSLSSTSIFSSSLNGNLNSELNQLQSTYSNLTSAISGENNSYATDPDSLYKAAEDSCKTISKTCSDNEVDMESIKKLYSLQITTDCDSYEKTLNNQVNSMKKNLLAADSTLKKARLQAEKDKNKYDFNQCVSALSDCMTTDAVCGENYEKCLDISGSIISSEGEIIANADVSKLVYAKCDDEDDENTENTTCSSNSEKFKTWLTNKIGTKKINGVCRGVMDLCQKYSYKNGKYNDKNDVVTSYLDIALNTIKANQTNLISEYQTSCISDLASCYKTNAKAMSVYSSSVTFDEIQDVITASCYEKALSCAKIIFKNDSDSCSSDNDDCVKNISKTIYKSLTSTYSCSDGYIYDSSTAKCIPDCEATVKTCVKKTNACQLLSTSGFGTLKTCYNSCKSESVCEYDNKIEDAQIAYISNSTIIQNPTYAKTPIVTEIVNLMQGYITSYSTDFSSGTRAVFINEVQILEDDDKIKQAKSFTLSLSK